MHQPASGAVAKVKRSWIDRLVTWGTSRRVPWWLLISGFWLVQFATIWVAAGLLADASGTELRYELTSTFFAPYGVFAYGYMMRRIRSAFDRFRPALTVSDDEARELRHRISSLPMASGLVFAFVGAAIGGAAAVTDPHVRDLFDTSPLSAVIVGTVNYAFNAAVAAVALGQLVRVLRAITRLHRSADAVDLFTPDSSRAFARATATASGLLVVAVAYSIATAPGGPDNPVWIGISFAALVFGALTFVLPLQGMRHKLRDQQSSLRAASSARIRRLAATIDSAVDEGRYQDLEELKTAAELLDREQVRIDSASARPWESHTLRTFVSTLLLPLAIWLLTSLLGRLLDL